MGRPTRPIRGAIRARGEAGLGLGARWYAPRKEGPSAHDDPDRARPDHDPGRPAAQRAGSAARRARDDRPRPGPGGRAAPARGPGQADRRGEVRRRPRLPRRLVRRHDPLDRRPRPLRRPRPRPGLRLVEGRRRHRGRHPRRRTSSARSRTTSRSSSRSAARSSTTPSRSPSSPRPTARRCAPRAGAAHASGPSRSRRSSTRSASDHVFAAYEHRAGRPRRRASPPPTSILEGEYRVGHQEQLYIENNAMIAVPARGRRRHRPRLAPVPVLRPQGAQARRSRLDDDQARVVQAETGGGFGGKEEYPSIIALHAALLAPQGRPAGPDDLRPPRGHRRDDEAPPGDRPPPDRRDRATAGSSPRTSRS